MMNGLRLRVEITDGADEGQDKAQHHVHRRAGQGDVDVVHPAGPGIRQGDLDGLAPADEPEARAEEDHDGRQGDGADRVGVGEGVERDPALETRERIAPPVGHPGVTELVQADRDDQQDELQQPVAKRHGVHLRRGRGRRRVGRWWAWRTPQSKRRPSG